MWMARAAGYRTPRFLTFKQALELGGNVRKGEHGTKVYFVKQLQVRDQGTDDDPSTRLVPMGIYGYSTSTNARTCPIASAQGTQSAFAIRTPGTSLLTPSSTQLARTSARAMVKPVMCR